MANISSVLCSWAPSIMIFVGLSLAAIGGFWGAIRQSADDAALRQQTTEISEKNEELASRLEKMVGSITGGDSYLSFRIRYNTSLKKAEVSAYVEGNGANVPGKYSLSDVKIEILNADGTLANSWLDYDAHLSVVQRFAPLDLPTDISFKFFQIKVFAKNGQYEQHFLLKKHTPSGEWFTHSIKFNDLHRVSMREDKLDSDYPDELKDTSPSVDEWRNMVLGDRDVLDGEKTREMFRRNNDDETHYGL